MIFEPKQDVHIMVIDDDEDELETLRLVTAGKTGLRLTLFDSPSACLITLNNIDRSFYPKLLLSDYHMPEMTGLDFLRLIKADPRFHMIPFAIYSTYSSSIVINACMKSGAVSYQTKPSTVDEYSEFIVRLENIFLVSD